MKSSQDWYYSDCTSGIIGTGDYKAWLDDFVEATNDYGWDDKNRAKWFSWFLTVSAKASWQHTLKPTKKLQLEQITGVFKGEYGIHLG